MSDRYRDSIQQPNAINEFNRSQNEAIDCVSHLNQKRPINIINQEAKSYIKQESDSVGYGTNRSSR
jgi:hypothetical protein